MSMPIVYSEGNLAADEMIDLLVRSTLAQRRPVDDRPRIAGMIAQFV